MAPREARKVELDKLADGDGRSARAARPADPSESERLTDEPKAGKPQSPREAQALLQKSFSPDEEENDEFWTDFEGRTPGDSPSYGQKSIRTIHRNRVVRIRFLEGGSKILFVSFTGIGHGGMHGDEFVGTAYDNGRNSALFVSDMQRLWYNHVNLAPRVMRTVWRVQQRLKPKKVVAIGNSMGGFGAILFSRMINADTVIAISPQFSVSDNVIPEEDRWLEYRKRIKMYRYPDISYAFGKQTQYFVFSGTAPEERRHMDRLPDARNIHKFYVPGQGHSVAAALKENGLQKRIISSCYTLPPALADLRIRRLLKKPLISKASSLTP